MVPNPSNQIQSSGSWSKSVTSSWLSPESMAPQVGLSSCYLTGCGIYECSAESSAIPEYCGRCPSNLAKLPKSPKSRSDMCNYISRHFDAYTCIPQTFSKVSGSLGEAAGFAEPLQVQCQILVSFRKRSQLRDHWEV